MNDPTFDETVDAVAEEFTVTLGSERTARLAQLRLVWHTGMVKTGSSALQQALWSARQDLRGHGICYPSSVLSTNDPRHQWVVATLRGDQLHRYAGELADIIDEADDADASTIILSAEGLSYQAPRFSGTSAAAVAATRKLADKLDTYLVVRPRASLLRSLYRQCLVNPPVEPEFGRDWTFDEFVTDPHIRAVAGLSSIIDFYDTANADVTLREYRPASVVTDFTDWLNLPPGTLTDPGRVNTSLSDAAAEQIRQLRSRGATQAEIQTTADQLRGQPSTDPPDALVDQVVDALNRTNHDTDQQIETRFGLPAGTLASNQ